MSETTVIRPTPKQREAKKLVNANTVTVFGGGIRSGKSYFLIYTILSYCFQYDNSRWLILRNSMTTLKRNFFPTFNSILDQGFRQYIANWNQETQILTFTNGSQIIFMGENYYDDKELNRFKGLEINGAGIDEVNEIQEATFNKVIERAGSWTHAGIVPIKIICTCNPSNTWVKEKVYDPWKRGDLKKGWIFIPALITDNPYISQEYKDSLKNNLPDYEYEVFVNGNWDVKLEGILFDRKDIKRFKRADIAKQEPHAVLGYADVADEGDDFFSYPIAKIWPGKIFITEAIFTRDNVDITIPRTAELIKKEKVQYSRVESNNHGAIFIRLLRQLVSPDKVLTVNNSAAKLTRILMVYGFIKQYVYLLDESEYEHGSEYDQFVKQIFTFMKDGSSPHDDAIDSLSGLMNFIQGYLPHLFKQ